ncbi:MAG TPA: hypothetical protein VF768_10855, partial [Holophagaceae bacterium]
MSVRQGKSSPASGQGLADPRPLPPKARRRLPSVAVLPFLDERPGPPETHLCEGLAEEILQGLNRLEGVWTLSRTTSFPHAGNPLTELAAVGRQLSTEVILGGALRLQNGGPILHTELLESATGRQLAHADRAFDRGNLFAILEEIIREVGSALHLKVEVHPHP